MNFYLRSCWSFSAVCSMEGQIFRSTGKLVSLSEQNLLDCDNTTIASSQTGCDGGNVENAFTYIRDYGIENNSYVYTSGVSGAAVIKKSIQFSVKLSLENCHIMCPKV